jgi:hypothetical protein
MAVLAHPDDESLAVGGTLATLSLASGNGDSGRDDGTVYRGPARVAETP